MDHDEYRESFVADPQPEPRFAFRSAGGPVLFFEDYEAAVEYYTAVFGPPGYIEGTGTHGWAIGSSFLTLLKGGDGAPCNTEIGFVMETPAEAERLQAALIDAGGTGPDPTDESMYEPIRYCPVTDPFGTAILVYAPLGSSGAA